MIGPLEVFLILVLGCVALFCYFLPGIVAYEREHKNRGAILALNLLAGWFFIGWVAALVWSLTGPNYNRFGRGLRPHLTSISRNAPARRVAEKAESPRLDRRGLPSQADRAESR